MMKNGPLHREDGPAIEWKDGNQTYYFNGQWKKKESVINNVPLDYLQGKWSNLITDAFQF